MGRHTNKLLERMNKVLLAQLHIGLWNSSAPNRPGSNRTWYVCLNWQDRNADKGKYRKIVLSDKLPYQTAKAIAMGLGKRCNLMVLQRKNDDYIIVGIPKERTNAIDEARDKKAVRELREAKKITAATWML
mgnify:FL=1